MEVEEDSGVECMERSPNDLGPQDWVEFAGSFESAPPLKSDARKRTQEHMLALLKEAESQGLRSGVEYELKKEMSVKLSGEAFSSAVREAEAWVAELKEALEHLPLAKKPGKSSTTLTKKQKEEYNQKRDDAERLLRLYLELGGMIKALTNRYKDRDEDGNDCFAVPSRQFCSCEKHGQYDTRGNALYDPHFKTSHGLSCYPLELKDPIVMFHDKCGSGKMFKISEGPRRFRISRVNDEVEFRWLPETEARHKRQKVEEVAPAFTFEDRDLMMYMFRKLDASSDFVEDTSMERRLDALKGQLGLQDQRLADIAYLIPPFDPTEVFLENDVVYLITTSYGLRVTKKKGLKDVFVASVVSGGKFNAFVMATYATAGDGHKLIPVVFHGIMEVFVTEDVVPAKSSNLYAEGDNGVACTDSTGRHLVGKTLSGGRPCEGGFLVEAFVSIALNMSNSDFIKLEQCLLDTNSRIADNEDKLEQLNTDVKAMFSMISKQTTVWEASQPLFRSKIKMAYGRVLMMNFYATGDIRVFRNRLSIHLDVADRMTISFNDIDTIGVDNRPGKDKRVKMIAKKRDSLFVETRTMLGFQRHRLGAVVFVFPHRKARDEFKSSVGSSVLWDDEASIDMERPYDPSEESFVWQLLNKKIF